MIGIRRFISAGGDMDDLALAAMMRRSMESLPLGERRAWLRHAELLLAGLGADKYSLAAGRVRQVLQDFAAELNAQPHDGGLFPTPPGRRW